MHVSNRGRSVHAADDETKAGLRRGGERRALHQIAAGVGHAERLVDRQIVNLAARPRRGADRR